MTASISTPVGCAGEYGDRQLATGVENVGNGNCIRDGAGPFEGCALGFPDGLPFAEDEDLEGGAGEAVVGYV